MDVVPKLIDVVVPADPAGVVLVLHGGDSRRHTAIVSPAQLSVLRMIPIAQRIARAGGGALAVFRLLNSRRDWDPTHTPADDARWALDRLADRFGERLPVSLVGHSLGGRAALLASDRPEVRSAVALAPWVYPTDLPSCLDGQRLLFVHGDDDRVARPDRSAELARRLAELAPTAYVSVAGATHSMLRRSGVFSGLASAFCTATLLGRSDSPTIARIEAGDTWIEV
jgi:pimeloyl-ACP methyl ester carboxylesterase